MLGSSESVEKPAEVQIAMQLERDAPQAKVLNTPLPAPSWGAVAQAGSMDRHERFKILGLLQQHFLLYTSNKDV